MTQPLHRRDQGMSANAPGAGLGIDVRQWSPRLRLFVFAIAMLAFLNGAVIGPMLRNDDLKNSIQQAIDTGERCVSGWKETTEKLKRTEAELERIKLALKP